ncbi:MAG: hypothetical protein EZS28_003855 [Streblomastix strix]|uniref:Uncharacterized protein n=1 Tax=Streblomastix strix TaxID=222440 RepID=A0A5J4X046_9EUKA|nr:MAG: hypothetical protein EZS28_003855 [Streblomastix strix]
MTEYSKGEEERKDVFYLETLSMSGQIQSIVIGRFFDRKIETIILAKSTFLSIFHNNDEEDSFEFVDHICVYKEVYCLCTSVQPHSLDCLFVLSIGGEWLLLQWDNSRFFPLATGSLLKAIQPLMKTPEQRRFRIDPTFQWAVSVVPITDNSPRFFTRPSPKQDQKHIPGQNKPIVRISFRALIVADETVFVGVKYDGPDANILSVIKDNWSSALKQFPRKFGFFGPNNKQGYKQENMNAILRNGLENEWKILQTIEQNKKNLCIANADTFIFLEDDDDQPKYIQQRDQQKKHPHSKKNTISLFQSINRVRHLVFTTSMRLEPFPIKKKPFIMSSFQFTTPLNREKDGEVAGPGLSEIERRGRIQLPEYVSSTSQKLEIQQLPINSEMKTTPEISTSETENQNQSCSTAIALVDTPSGLALLSLLFDFEHKNVSLHSFAIAAIPPQASRIMPVLDENRAMKTLKGEDINLLNRVRSADVNILKGVERQNYPFKWFNELAITNGANWYQTKQPNQQQQPLSDNSEIDLLSNNSLLSDETNSKNDINNSQLKIGTQMLFVISASNSSMIVDMNTGTFYDFPGQQADQKDVGEGQPEDFQMNPTNVSQVCPIPNYSYSPYHQMEDKFILGVGNGRTGALHSIGIGHRLQTIMQGKWYEKDLPALFTTKAYSGAKMHSLLLVEEEQIVDINNQLEKIKVKKQSKSESHIKQQTLYPYKKAQVLSVGNNIYTSYSSSIFELHEDVVEPIDSFIVGIDTTKKTLALGPAQGAFIQVTTSEIRVIPTLNYFACPVYQTKSSSQQQQLQQKNSTSLVKSVSQDEQQFAGIATQIDYEIRVVFECACITDNLIALSYKCIVFVLIWNPSKPRIPTSKTIQNQSTKYQSSKILQLSAFVYPIATLCFPSPVKSLNAQTICTRSFLVVGCDQPPAVFLLRLDTLQVAKDSEDKRRQLWKDGEQLLKKLKYQLTYPPVQRPNHSLVIQNGVKELNNQDDKHQIHIGEQNQSSILITENISVTEHRKDKDTIINKQYRFVEVMSGSHQFVEVQYTQNAIMTRILDLFPYDKPEQILLTTFNRQCRLFTQEEIDANDRKSLYGEQTNSQTSLIIQSSEKQILLTKKTYERNEGAVLMIAGIHGQLSTSIIPLSAILDFLPEQPSKENKLKKTQFFFPSLISTIKLYPERIKITDDDSNVYIFGDRVSVLNWNDRACKILWNDLECAGIIHSLQPMRIKEEDAQLQSIKDESSNLNEETSLLNNSQHVSGSNTTSKTPVPHPTLAWIDYVQKRLTFGAIDRRNIVIRDVKDIPSQPIAIAHIPTLHAIAVLCREPSQNPYQIKSKDDIQDSDIKILKAILSLILHQTGSFNPTKNISKITE